MRQCLFYLARLYLVLLTLLAANAMAQGKGVVDVAQIGGPCNAVQTAGNLAYMAEGYNLTILNITNKEKPVRVGGLALAFKAQYLALAGSKIYVAGGGAMQIIDVADPATPLPQGRIPDSGSIAIKGKTVYVAGGAGRIRIYDVSNPFAPVAQTPVALVINSWKLAISGDMLYALGGWDGALTLYALNVSTPGNPVLRGKLDIGGHGNISSLVAEGGTVVLTAISGDLRFIDARNPARMIVKKVFYDSPRHIPSLALAGGRAYAAMNIQGNRTLTIYDVSNLDAVARLGSCTLYKQLDEDIINPVGNVALAGGYAYTAGGGDNMAIVDVHAPSAPRVAGIYATPTQPTAQAISGKLAYVADLDSGLKILDVSNPGVPVIKGTYPLPESSRCVVAVGTRVYMCTPNHLYILDISTPANPRLLGTYPSSKIEGIAAQGNTVYLGRQSDGLKILDVSNPAAPVQLAMLPLQNATEVLLWKSGYVLVKTVNSLAVVDVRNPRSPVRVSEIPKDFMHDFKVAGNFVYTINGDGLFVYDLTLPAQPRLHASLPNQYTPYSVLGVSGSYLYTAHVRDEKNVRALNIYDLRTPGRPVLVDGYPLAEDPVSLDVIGDHVYVGSPLHGYRVFRNAAPIHVFSPGGPATYKGGDAVRLHWKSDLMYAGTGTLLELWNSVGRVATLGYDWSPRGENGRLINLPLAPVGSDYRIRVRSTWDGRLWGQSERPFTITGGPVRVQAPNGGETWQAGTRQNVSWKINPQLAGGTVWIELWRAGRKVAHLGAGVVGAGGEGVTSLWMPPSVAAGTDYKIRVISAYKPAWWDESDKTIKIMK